MNIVILLTMQEVPLRYIYYDSLPLQYCYDTIAWVKAFRING